LDEAEEIGCGRRRLVLGQLVEVLLPLTAESAGFRAEAAQFGVVLALSFGECLHGPAEAGHYGVGLGQLGFSFGLGLSESVHAAVERGPCGGGPGLGFGECGHCPVEAGHLATLTCGAFCYRHGLCSFSVLALAVGVLSGDGADQDVEVVFETADACVGGVYELTHGFGDGADFRDGVGLDLDNGLEGLLDIKPTVFDMFQAFFRGHGCFEFSSHPGAGALGGTG
jgi:hypothetical protein